MFNSLKYAKQLEQVGVSREQAEAHLQIIGEIMESNFATREDLVELKHIVESRFAAFDSRLNSLKSDFESKLDTFESKLDSKLDTLESKFDSKLDALELKFDSRSDAIEAKSNSRFDALEAKIIQSEQRMTIKLGTIVSLAIGVAVTLAKLVT